MKRRRHTPEQIVRKLREADRLAGEGREAAEIARALEVSEPTLCRWRNQFGGMKADDVKGQKELERENCELKQIVADKELEVRGLKEIAKGTSRPGPQAPGGSDASGPPRRQRAPGLRDRRPASLDPAPRAQAGAR